jgi:WhiB family transcriptional regulator, redox-sensing transcriptional regulator
VTATSPANQDWRDSAACRNKDPDDFFPPGHEDSPGYVRQAEKAIKVCTGCTVRPECLDFALAAHRQWGIWGGTSDPERRAVLPALTRGTA